MSASALIRAIALLFIGLLFLYAGIFNPQMMNQGGSGPPAASEGTGRLIDLGVGLASGLFGLWVIRRQWRTAPQPLVFGTTGKVLVALAVILLLTAVGFGFWRNAHYPSVPPSRQGQPASPTPAVGSPAPAPAPVPPASTSGDEPAVAPGPLPAAVPQAGGPAPAPAPLPPTGR